MRTLVTGMHVLVAVTIIFYIGTFKIIDSDFWWHVKAGEIMWNAHALIRSEPFSYVLAGKPYSALHEWLAQIIFYRTYHAGGAVGSILLRDFLTAATALTLLAIDWRRALPNAFLLIIALYVHRPSLMIRPQLFTVLLLGLSLLLLFRYLFQDEDSGSVPVSRRVRLAASILCIQVLWVNLHGASAIFGVLFIGAFFLQSCLDWYRADPKRSGTLLIEVHFRALLLGMVCTALLFSPNGIKTFADMYAHAFDRTIPLVREWMPLAWYDYAAQVFPFGALALVLVLCRRRALVFCLTALLITGLLSLQSYRHCIVFVMTSLGMIFFQLSTWSSWKVSVDRLYRYPLLTLVGGCIGFGLVFSKMYRNDLGLRREGTFGFGVQMPVEGAYDFIERSGIRGTMFNTYNQGGYLLFRGAPERRVFADGRNIDYGYAFVQKLLDAGVNSVRWREIQEQYQFTYAVVEYKADPKQGSALPYIMNLAADPSWILVYIDDWAAVYVRDLPQYTDVIARKAYHLLSPNALEFSNTIDTLSPDKWPQAETELLRVAKESPLSIKPRLILGDHYLQTKRFDEAQTVALQALDAEPYRPEIYELLGRISAERQDWAQAGAYLERAVALSSGDGPGINYDYLAMIFSKAGEGDKAEKYHMEALRHGQK